MVSYDFSYYLYRLGTEDVGLEYQAPQPVQTLLRLQVNVISVSSGALHSLALTDCGVSFVIFCLKVSSYLMYNPVYLIMCSLNYLWLYNNFSLSVLR